MYLLTCVHLATLAVDLVFRLNRIPCEAEKTLILAPCRIYKYFDCRGLNFKGNVYTIATRKRAGVEVDPFVSYIMPLQRMSFSNLLSRGQYHKFLIGW